MTREELERCLIHAQLPEEELRPFLRDVLRSVDVDEIVSVADRFGAEWFDS